MHTYPDTIHLHSSTAEMIVSLVWFDLQIFLVRRDANQKTMVLAVRLPDQLGEPHVKELPIKEEKSCEFFCIEKWLYFQLDLGKFMP